MDDTLEEEAPKARTKAGKAPSRKSAAEAPAAKPKARSSSARQATTEEAKAPRKAPARRKAAVQGDKDAKPAPARKGKAAAAGAEARPAARTPRAPAKDRQAKPTVDEVRAQPAPAPAVPVHAKAPPPKPQVAVPADAPQGEPYAEGPAGDVTIHPVEPHVPSVHPHDEGLEFGLSPVDLTPDAGVREEAGLGWFIRILALSSVLLVLFNSFAIDKWAREQPVTPINSRVLIAAHGLHAEMKGFHLDAPLEGMRSLWHGIRDARWPGSAGDREKSTAENPSVK